MSEYRRVYGMIRSSCDSSCDSSSSSEQVVKSGLGRRDEGKGKSSFGWVIAGGTRGQIDELAQGLALELATRSISLSLWGWGC